jgi:lipopolysaccharide export system protein LptA
MKHAAIAGFLILTLVPALIPGAALAQGGILGKHDTDKPLTIEANKSEYDDKAKTFTYSGNVVVVQGAIRLRADALKAEQNTNRILANGKVVVTSPTSGTVTGNNGIYDLTRKIVTLSGDVVLNKPGQATMKGSLLTVNMVTGQAQLGAAAVAGTANTAPAAGLPGGRVQGVFTPKSGGQ